MGPLCQEVCQVETHGQLLDLLRVSPPFEVTIADLATLLSLDASAINGLRPPAATTPLVVATDLRPEDSISALRQLRIYSMVVKSPPFDAHELAVILDSVRNPAQGFGLVLHFDQTMEMYSLNARTRESKNEVVDRVINYFATNGFEIHELYDVRLILEELINNAFYHAFRLEDGSEKYHLGSLKALAPGEEVRIEFGNAGSIVGFTVTDNAGTLHPDTILERFERQYKKHGLFDERGRGLYISRMLATNLFFNIQEGRRTQVVAIFREKDRKQRVKPLIINFASASSLPPEPVRPATPKSAVPPPPPQPVPPLSLHELHEDLD